MKLALSLSVLLVAGAARATVDPPGKAEARALLAEGNARFAAGQIDAALTHFRRAFAVFPSPKLLVNTAACEQLLGHLDLAASDLDEYLRRYAALTSPTDDERRLEITARTDLERMRASLGRIEWPSAPEGAVMEVNDAQGWLVRYAKPGHHRVLQRVGNDKRRSTVTVSVGHVVVLDFATQPLAGPAEQRRRPKWVVPVAVAGSVVVVGLALGLGLGLGLHHDGAALGGTPAGFTF